MKLPILEHLEELKNKAVSENEKDIKSLKSIVNTMKEIIKTVIS